MLIAHDDFDVTFEGYNFLEVSTCDDFDIQ
jgi:hypothetical protein